MVANCFHRKFKEIVITYKAYMAWCPWLTKINIPMQFSQEQQTGNTHELEENLRTVKVVFQTYHLHLRTTSPPLMALWKLIKKALICCIRHWSVLYICCRILYYFLWTFLFLLNNLLTDINCLESGNIQYHISTIGPQILISASHQSFG